MTLCQNLIFYLCIYETNGYSLPAVTTQCNNIIMYIFDCKYVEYVFYYQQ